MSYMVARLIAKVFTRCWQAGRRLQSYIRTLYEVLGLLSLMESADRHLDQICVLEAR